MTSMRKKPGAPSTKCGRSTNASLTCSVMSLAIANWLKAMNITNLALLRICSEARRLRHAMPLIGRVPARRWLSLAGYSGAIEARARALEDKLRARAEQGRPGREERL